MNDHNNDYDWTRVQYHYRRLIECKGTHHRVDMDDKDYDPTLIKFFRYVVERWEGPVRPYSWWSELETNVPRFAGEATGIPDEECVWRLEWTLTVEEAKKLVRCGHKRISRVGWFTEYENLEEVSADQITWHKMAKLV